jgi:SOS-response transcriptional repressor LexA
MSQDCSYNELYPLQVLDDSMEPEFPEKCVIVVEPSEVCATGAFVVAETQGERWFRQFISAGSGGKRLVALKAGYPDIELKDGEYKILGVIVQRNLGRKVKHYHPYAPNGVPAKTIELN